MLLYFYISRSIKEQLFKLFEKNRRSIDEKLQILQNQLQQFKTAFSDLETITLTAKINQNDQSQFRNHFQLLDYIREQVLAICGSSPVYVFHIDFQSDNDAAGNFIGQILQLPSINRCEGVGFLYCNETFIQLPVEVIANWLNRNFDDGIGGTGQSKKERQLVMHDRIRIQNAGEICDRLKTVRTFHLFSNIYKFLKKTILILSFFQKCN